MFATPRPVPARVVPAVAATMLVALALPVFLVAGWDVSAWALGAVLWVGGQAVAALLPRVRPRDGSVAAASVMAFGMMFRVFAVMVVLVAVAASDASLAIAAGAVYALAYTLELGLSLLTYFGSPARR